MSLQVQVGTSPNAILFGQQRACTVTNTGLVTVYLGEDSTTTAGVDFPLLPGASIHYDDGVQAWGVVDPASSIVGQVQVLFDSDQIFSPAGSGARVVYDNFLSVASFGVIPYRASGASVPGSVTVILYAKTATTPLAGANNQNLGISFGELIPTLPTETPPTDTLRIQDLTSQLHTAGWRINTAGLSTTYYQGQVLFAATFPNVTGAGGYWMVSIPSGLTTSSVGVRVILNQYSVPATIATNSPGVGSGSVVLSADGTSNGQWRGVAASPQIPFSSTWWAGTFTVAASTTQNLYLPTLSGPVRVRVSGTQTGAGSMTITPWEITNLSSLGADITAQYDTALVSSTAAGAFFGAATYAVWPTSPMMLRVTTAAGVSVSGLAVWISSGVQ